MKTTSTCFAGLLAVSATAASAGNLTEPPAPAPQPVIVEPAAPMASWDGFYGGLAYGRASGDYEFSDDDETFEENDLDDGTAAGVFLGYNRQNGNFVYGGELAYYQFDELEFVNEDDELIIEAESALDLSGRIGYTFNRFMVYASAGYSKVDYDDIYYEDVSGNGFNYGLGAEYLVTDNFVVGVDYTARDIEGELTDPDLDEEFDLDSNVDTLTLRASYKF